MAELFFRDNLSQVDWNESFDDQYLKNFITPLIQEGTAPYVSNVTAEAFIIRVGKKHLPGILSSKQSDCYVASPYAQYIDYAKAELVELRFPPLEWILKVVLSVLGAFLRICRFNDVVYVNNWLLSTNLYLPLEKNEILEIVEKLKEKFPNRVIVFRSLNKKTDEELIKNLGELGAKRTISRQVYITDPENPDYEQRKDFKKDKSFLNRTELSLKEDGFDGKEIEKMRELYNKLYLKKYFLLNPQFTKKYFENAVNHRLFEFQYFHQENKEKAVLGYFYRSGVMTTPIFGFDTEAKSSEGLYRLISAKLMKDSKEKGFVLNQSSGAAEFKRQRGAKPFLEYNYYFSDHCSLKQRFSWSLLSSLLNSLGAFLLTRFKL
ncbi:MAG: hypothetical protein NXH75_12230 [Halobacteriovoraceae bacterium]|nr:hypothetical protein [Halobacteriovoraceae bacterium]